MAGALLPRRRFGTLDLFRNEMDELFDRFFNDEGGGPARQAWAPRVDVKETEKEIVIKADLPGVDPKDIEIQVVDGSLTLRGEKREEKEEKKGNVFRSERFVGQFYREIPLPPGADAEKVSAASTRGVVTVTIPKKAEAQPKKISVKAQD
jgi:HSP20 family protein